jgi:hypothetical protein
MQQIKMQRKEFERFNRLINKVLNIEQMDIQVQIKDNYMYPNHLDPCHVMLVRPRFQIESEIKDKFVEILYEDFEKALNSNEEVVSLNVKEPFRVHELSLNYENFNKIKMEIWELCDFLRACKLLNCDVLIITDKELIGYDREASIKKLIKSECKQNDIKISFHTELLTPVCNFIKEEYGKRTRIELYFGKCNGKNYPLLIKNEEIEAYIAPINEP